MIYLSACLQITILANTTHNCSRSSEEANNAMKASRAFTSIGAGSCGSASSGRRATCSSDMRCASRGIKWEARERDRSATSHWDMLRALVRAVMNLGSSALRSRTVGKGICKIAGCFSSEDEHTFGG